MSVSGNGERDGMIQPDPLRGRIGDARYAEHYARSHAEGTDTLAYRSDYIDILTLDALMPDGYSLLDVGCGTGGYHGLLARCGRVHGIDPIPEMIAIAKKLPTGSIPREHHYTCSTFEDLPDIERYDVVRTKGVYGWYYPWPAVAPVLDKTASLLKPGGLTIVSYVPPTSLIGAVKAVLASRRTVVIFRSRFLAMLHNAGFEPLFEIRQPNNTTVFARIRDVTEKVDA